MGHQSGQRPAGGGVGMRVGVGLEKPSEHARLSSGVQRQSPNVLDRD